jgi:hypothetical protein
VKIEAIACVISKGVYKNARDAIFDCANGYSSSMWFIPVGILFSLSTRSDIRFMLDGCRWGCVQREPRPSQAEVIAAATVQSSKHDLEDRSKNRPDAGKFRRLKGNRKKWHIHHRLLDAMISMTMLFLSPMIGKQTSGKRMSRVESGRLRLPL